MNEREKLDREFIDLTLRIVEIEARLKSFEQTVAGLQAKKKMKPYPYSEIKVKEYVELQDLKQKIQNRKQEIIRELNKLLMTPNDAYAMLTT